MANKDKNPALEDSGRVSEYSLDKMVNSYLTNAAKDTQVSNKLEPLYWRAYQNCINRYQENPTIENRLIAQSVAHTWKRSFKQEEVRHD